MKNNLTLTLIVLLFGCQSQNKSDLDSTGITEIEIHQSEDNLPLSSIADSVKYILLKTDNETSVVGSIFKLVYVKNRFYALDLNNNTIWVFDINGNLMKAFRPTGKGPREFESIQDFDVNENGELALYDGNLLKVLLYNSNFDFQQEFYTNKLSHCLTILSDKSVFFYQGFIPSVSLEKADEYYNLYHTASGAVERAFFPFKKPPVQLRILPQTVFSRWQNEIYYCSQFTDTIYSITSENIKPKYIVDFGANKIPTDLFDRNGGKSFDEQRKLIMEFSHLKNTFLETEKFVYFIYLNKAEAYRVIYNKTSKNATSNRQILNDFDSIGSGNIMASGSNLLISVIPTETIDFDTLNKGKSETKKSNFSSIKGEINQMSNPIIALYYLK